VCSQGLPIQDHVEVGSSRSRVLGCMRRGKILSVDANVPYYMYERGASPSLWPLAGCTGLSGILAADLMG
jgi:hypothetical protein